MSKMGRGSGFVICDMQQSSIKCFKCRRRNPVKQIVQKRVELKKKKTIDEAN